MEKHGCTSAAYVGDTDGDCKASFKAAVPFVHAAYGFGSISDEGLIAASAESFEQLAEILHNSIYNLAKFFLVWYNAYKTYSKKEVSQCTVFLSQMMTIIRV